jgi:hypothetical protein
MPDWSFLIPFLPFFLSSGTSFLNLLPEFPSVGSDILEPNIQSVGILHYEIFSR